MFIIPRATEKTYIEQAKRTYVFQVPASASKQAVAQAVAEQFSVTVTDIRILIRKGKKTRFNKGKHAYPGTTYKQDKKFAYVTLKEGDKIRVFNEEAVEESSKDEQKTAKTAKKASSKEAKKEGDK